MMFDPSATETYQRPQEFLPATVPAGCAYSSCMSAEVQAVRQVTQLARQFEECLHARDALQSQVAELQSRLEALQSQQSAEAHARAALEEGAALLERECLGLRAELEEVRRNAASLTATVQNYEAHLREQRHMAERAQLEAGEYLSLIHI